MRKYVVYVAGPYSAPTKEEKIHNVAKAVEAAKQLVLLGFSVIVPHKISEFWDEDERFIYFEHADWLNKVDFPLQDRCDLVFLCEGWKDSLGALAEHGRAHEFKQPHSESVTELCVLRNYLETGHYKEAREAHHEESI